MTDNVNHPSHYTQGGVECIDAITAATVNKTGIEAVCTANVIKYLWRYESKNGLEDVKKAQWYIKRLIAELEEYGGASMTDITELAQREKFEAWAEERCALTCGYLKNRRTNTGYFSKHDYTNLWAAWKAAGAELVEALEKAQQHIARQEQIILNQDESLSIRRGELEAAQQHIGELERKEEALRPVGVMSEKAYHRLENRESRFIALWPRPEIYLPRKRPEDGVIVYARTAATTGIKWEAE